MVGDYDVYFCHQHSGRVQVQRQGLYYRFQCRCRLTGDVVCRLYVSCGGKRENLGVVVPMDGGFGLDTRVPVKRFSAGEPEFSLEPRQEAAGGTYAPIIPEEPFSYIERLKTGFLVRKYGEAGVFFPETHNELQLKSLKKDFNCPKGKKFI